MVDPKLGTKRVCEACGAKFYDLNKSPATCPKCGQTFDPLAAMTAEQPVRDIAPTAENKDSDDDGELEDDDDALSLEDMVHIFEAQRIAVSYTHLTLPTILLV